MVTKVNIGWFDNFDGNNRKLSDYLFKASDFEVACSACDQKKINVRSSGYKAIAQHICSNRHKANIALLFGTNTFIEGFQGMKNKFKAEQNNS